MIQILDTLLFYIYFFGLSILIPLAAYWNWKDGKEVKKRNE